MLGIKIEILAIALENGKILTTKTFHRNTYSCLISRIGLHCFVEDYLLKNSSTFTGKKFASKSLFK